MHILIVTQTHIVRSGDDVFPLLVDIAHSLIPKCHEQDALQSSRGGVFRIYIQRSLRRQAHQLDIMETLVRQMLARRKEVVHPLSCRLYQHHSMRWFRAVEIWILILYVLQSDASQQAVLSRSGY